MRDEVPAEIRAMKTSDIVIALAAAASRYLRGDVDALAESAERSMAIADELDARIPARER